MHRSRLFQLLQPLSSAELEKFLEYVHSPYFNKNQKVRELANLIGEHFPDLTHSDFERNRLFEILFPGEEMKMQKLYDHFSYLVGHLEQFWMLQQLEQDDFQQELFLLSAYREQGLSSFFDRQRKKMQNRLEQRPERNEQYFSRQFQIAREGAAFYLLKKEEGRHTDQHLQADFMDYQYLAGKFKTACEMVNRQNVMGGEYDLSGLESAMEYYRGNLDRFGEVPAIALYYQVLLMLLEDEEESHYERLIVQLGQFVEKFSETEARDLYQYAQNYCIRKLNRGNTDYLGKLFELYKLLLENGLMYEEGQISQWDYKNIVSVALRLEEKEWTLEFIENNRSHLEPRIRENAYAYNLANYLFSLGKYGEALKNLQQVELTDVFYHLGTKSTLLKIYYEMDEMEVLFSHLSAFKVYLQRNRQISPYQYTIHNNLLRLTKQLYRLRLKHESSRQGVNPKHIKEFREKVEGIKQVANIHWLLSKVEELESSGSGKVTRA